MLLLLQCARPGAGAEPTTAALAGAVDDWDQLLEAADYHGLGSLFHRLLDDSCPGAVPAPVAQRLRDTRREASGRSLFLTGKLLELLDAFKAAGIAALPLKGPVLAEWLYSDPALRPFSDLDILIRPADVPAALLLLEQNGYLLAPHMAGLSARTLASLHCEATVRRRGGAQVDIHWDTAPADYPFRFDPEILWRSQCARTVDGRTVAGLEPESLLLFLCVHGTKHMWSRLMWLGDVARLAREIHDWDAALGLAREAGCLRPVLTGLLLAHELLEAPIGDDVVRAARATPIVGELVRQAARRLERISPSEPGSMELTRFNARMAEAVWHKARHYGARVWGPTEAELERVRLPRALFPLYYPYRIARLAGRYIARYALKPLGYGSTGSRY
jgi:hypothetical protein